MPTNILFKKVLFCTCLILLFPAILSAGEKAHTPILEDDYVEGVLKNIHKNSSSRIIVTIDEETYSLTNDVIMSNCDIPEKDFQFLIELIGEDIEYLHAENPKHLKGIRGICK